VPTHMSQIPLDVLIEAKRVVSQYARSGRLLSPHDAWILSGETEGMETLWSIAHRIALENDVSPQELCAYLEKIYPVHTMQPKRCLNWDDIIHGGPGTRPC